MTCAEPLGVQNLDGLADQFVARVTEHVFGLGVHPGTATLPVNDQDRVGGECQDAVVDFHRSAVPGKPAPPNDRVQQRGRLH